MVYCKCGVHLQGLYEYPKRALTQHTDRDVLYIWEQPISMNDEILKYDYSSPCTILSLVSLFFLPFTATERWMTVQFRVHSRWLQILFPTILDKGVYWLNVTNHEQHNASWSVTNYYKYISFTWVHFTPWQIWETMYARSKRCLLIIPTNLRSIPRILSECREV